MKDNKELVRLYFEAFNTEHVEILDEILDSGFRVRGLHMKSEDISNDQRGPDFFKKALIASHDSFPDGHITIDEMVAEGDKVMVRWTFEGTHAGEFAGIRATNRRITYSGINGFHVVAGKLASAWDMWDRLNLWQQLGVLPETAEFLAKTRNT